MTDDEILRLPFDIARHKAARYLDLEIMVAPNGTAVYALPSHQEFLIKRAMELHHWTREALMDACPPEFYGDFMRWLIPLAGGWIPVWPIGILDYPDSATGRAAKATQTGGALPWSHSSF